MNKYLSLIKFSHTIFAMPFAMIGFFLASFSQEVADISAEKCLLVILCMVTARSAAMAFNRYLDRDIDKKNERTAVREIPSGVIKAQNAIYFIIVNVILFISCAYFINRLCFYLSPIALLVILGYSYTKRFTFLCHLVLGLGLSLAPIGAYLAVTGAFALLPVILGSAVLFWVAGFDTIYALQDEEFERQENLNSFPVLLGRKNALLAARIMHVISASSMIIAYIMARQDYPSLQFASLIGLIIFLSMLMYQHTLVKANDLSKINLAFFTTNGIASLVFGSLFILDLFF